MTDIVEDVTEIETVPISFPAVLLTIPVIALNCHPAAAVSINVAFVCGVVKSAPAAASVITILPKVVKLPAVPLAALSVERLVPPDAEVTVT